LPGHPDSAALRKAIVLKWFFGLVIAGWCGLLGVMFCGRVGSTTPQPARPLGPASEKHYVSVKQLTASGAWRDQRVAPFAARAHDGTRFASKDLVGRRPAVLVFIKTDCPCSVEFEPFFQRLERRYHGLVRFFGVIDANRAGARRYAQANNVPYPVVADADRSIITRFQVETGGYVVLLKPAGMVDTLWPGCSAEMMKQLGRRIAVLAGVKERPLDLTGIPAVLTTGCPFAE
jgi:peroxiredoxin